MKVINHPGYNIFTNEDDIAVIKVGINFIFKLQMSIVIVTIGIMIIVKMMRIIIMIDLF